MAKAGITTDCEGAFIERGEIEASAGIAVAVDGGGGVDGGAIAISDCDINDFAI